MEKELIHFTAFCLTFVDEYIYSFLSFVDKAYEENFFLKTSFLYVIFVFVCRTRFFSNKMPPPCAIETCKIKSWALCPCCSMGLCFNHLKEHKDLSNSQLITCADEINTIGHQLSALNIDEVIESCRLKLDKWRDDCYMLINRYYVEKCQELQQRCTERTNKHRERINEIKTKINDLIPEQKATHEDICSLKATINDIKRDIDQFQAKGIIVDVGPLIIPKDMIYIEQWVSDEVDITTLSSPFQNIDCSNENYPVMASSNRFLLLDQNPNLCLFDRELTLIKQIPWERDRIPDMCWSSVLNSFIMITDKDGVFLINKDMTLIESIQTIEKEKWLSCTCSDASLFLTTNTWDSDIYEFHLSSPFNLIQQWDPRNSCENEEGIQNIAYSNETLALTIKNKSTKTITIELVSSTTLDRLWSLPLDLTHNNGQRIYRVCLLRCDEWLVIDHQITRLFHISKDGKLKFTRKYNPTPENVFLIWFKYLSY